ncbi:MAG: tRNA dihydrouridine synthase [Lachnospiraceae bacterium]
MKFYLAPLEGVTGYAYRCAYAKYFGDVDKYFAPFISSNHENKLTPREKNDILPEHNKNVALVPQILSCNAKDFVHTAESIASFGYREINLNLGCPSGTVTAKGKGAGFLADPFALERFFEEVFSHTQLEISVKTRIGYADAEEFEDLLEIFNRYPIKEVIVHPRTRKDFYKNTPDWDAFELAMEKSDHPVIYNGDIFTKADYDRLLGRFPNLEGVMLGRGILSHPDLVSVIKGKDTVTKETLLTFHDEILAAYVEIMSGERNVLFRMKELWDYMGCSFTNAEKYTKKIRKAQNLQSYQAIIHALFTEQQLVTP